MSAGNREWIKAWLAALYFLVLAPFAPIPVASSVAILAATAGITRNLFAGIGLAVASFPFGWWLIDHPGTFAIFCSIAGALPILWWYRREIRSRL